MIRWVNQLYISDNLMKKKDKVIAAISCRKATFNIYCITFASQPRNLFDIIDANELLFPHYRNVDICIVGLAKGKENAIQLVQKMLEEIYYNTGEFDVRSYFT
ncbi:MAG: hypothetical protein GX288_02200 [Clostridiales bacterium]|jgi:hypothetical protein|nr:hypothetical protein [Clostridiales bacterium]